MSPDAYIEMAATEDSHWWFRGRRDILASVIARLRLPDEASILEIGAGTGGNLAMLSAYGRIHAVEMDASASEVAKQKTGGRYDIRRGRCPDDMPFDDRRFDLVCLFDCLEHIGPDVEALRCVKRLLKPEGAALISVPAHPWLWSAHDEFLHHQRRYSRTSLRDVAETAGLRVGRMSYFNTLLFPVAVAARMKDRLSRAGTSTGTALPPSSLNAMLYRIFASERWILPHAPLPFGVSLLAVLRA